MLEHTPRVLLAALLLTLLGGCSERAEEKLARLERMSASGESADALSEINELLTEKNKELSEPLDEERADRILKLSADGRVAAWSQDEELYIRDQERTYNIDLDAPISDFTLSSNGRYAAATIAGDNECVAAAVDVRDQSVRETNLPEGPCYLTPAISDDGQLLYLPREKSLWVLALNSGARTEITPAQTPPKYRNLSNIYTVTSAGRRGALIFYGAAGYYDLYYYPGQGSQLTRLLQNVARPYFFPSTQGATLASPDDLEVEAPPPDRLKLGEADGFVYSGGAGRWQLHALRLSGERPQAGANLPAPAFSQLAFLRNRRVFLAQSRERLHYWNPYTRKKRELPLLARKFEMGAEGLLYVDLLNRLYLRRSSFSELEIRLTQMRNRIARETDEDDQQKGEQSQ
ncbi:MAG: hypothetical protein K1X75_07995 [Leptospirales bacterium]|nr:hypothetical protein [Leptospirales bacterium]